MEKTIEVGTIKAGFAQGGYFNAKVVYKGEDISEQPVREVTTVVTKIDDTLPTGEYLVVRYGQDNIFRSADEWFFIFQEERPEEPKQTKQPKLSKTMQKVLDRAKNAGWYYKNAATGKSERFSEKGRVRDIGHEGFAITEGGYIYGQMSSATLAALEKRGLIEVRQDGGSELDFFKVVGHELPERLSTAIVVKLTRNNKKTGGKSTENVYMATPEDMKAIKEKFHETDYHTYEFEIVGNAELTVWKIF